MCIYEHSGVQIQVHVTSDEQEFIGVVTTGVLDALNQNGPGIDSFIDALKGVGVTIEGEDALRATVASSTNWTEEVVRLAQTGRKQGIRFLRKSPVWPTDAQLEAIVRGYPFKGEARTRMVVNFVQA